MEKIKVAIASVLKPLKDPRAYYRMGLSLRETNKYRINIIGFSIKNKSVTDYLIFTPLFCQKRTHWKRFFVGLKFIKILVRQSPEILILSTYELLPAAVFVKQFLKFKLIYDVQENYSNNLRFNKTGTGIMRGLTVNAIKIIEKFSKPYIDHYIFAEQCYVEEFPGINNYTVLENKHYGKIRPRIPFSPATKASFSFLISGTLTEVYGTLKGIGWFKQVLGAYPGSKLKIIGHVPLADYGIRILKEIKGFDAIEVEIGNTPIPYEELLSAHRDIDFCLMPYHQLPSIAPKMPSKLFDAVALGIPSLFSANKKWSEFVEPYQAGQAVDFNDITNAAESFAVLIKKTYFTEPVSEDVLWKSDKENFLNIIQNMS